MINNKKEKAFKSKLLNILEQKFFNSDSFVIWNRKNEKGEMFQS